jgi:hypothetical protein
MGEERQLYKVLVAKPKQRDISEDQGVRGRIRIRMGLREIGLGVWIGCNWLRTGTDGGLL